MWLLSWDGPLICFWLILCKPPPPPQNCLAESQNRAAHIQQHLFVSWYRIHWKRGPTEKETKTHRLSRKKQKLEHRKCQIDLQRLKLWLKEVFTPAPESCTIGLPGAAGSITPVHFTVLFPIFSHLHGWSSFSDFLTLYSGLWPDIYLDIFLNNNQWEEGTTTFRGERRKHVGGYKKRGMIHFIQHDSDLMTVFPLLFMLDVTWQPFTSARENSRKTSYQSDIFNLTYFDLVDWWMMTTRFYFPPTKSNNLDVNTTPLFQTRREKKENKMEKRSFALCHMIKIWKWQLDFIIVLSES